MSIPRESHHVWDDDYVIVNGSFASTRSAMNLITNLDEEQLEMIYPNLCDDSSTTSLPRPSDQPLSETGKRTKALAIASLLVSLMAVAAFWLVRRRATVSMTTVQPSASKEVAFEEEDHSFGIVPKIYKIETIDHVSIQPAFEPNRCTKPSAKTTFFFHLFRQLKGGPSGDDNVLARLANGNKERPRIPGRDVCRPGTMLPGHQSFDQKHIGTCRMRPTPEVVVTDETWVSRSSESSGGASLLHWSRSAAFHPCLVPRLSLEQGTIESSSMEDDETSVFWTGLREWVQMCLCILGRSLQSLWDLGLVLFDKTCRMTASVESRRLASLLDQQVWIDTLQERAVQTSAAFRRQIELLGSKAKVVLRDAGHYLRIKQLELKRQKFWCWFSNAM